MTNPTIDQALDQIKNKGFANPSRYSVAIYRQGSFTSAIQSVQDAATGTTAFNQAGGISLQCEIVSIPGIGITSFERRLYGPSRKLPYGVLHNEMIMSFYCDEKHTERRYFEKWINSIVDADTFNISFYDDFISKITIKNFDNSGRESISVDLEEAYPIGITAIDLGYSNTQAIEKVVVNFAYRKYKTFEPNLTQITQQGVFPPTINNSLIPQTGTPSISSITGLINDL